MSDAHEERGRAELNEKPSGVHASPARTHESPRIVSPETVYGTVIVAAIVFAVSSDDNPWHVFLITIGSVLVLWAAHVYAEAVAAHGRNGMMVVGVRAAVRLGIAQSSGILYSAVLPVILLLLGALGLLNPELSVDLALWSSVILLGVLGYFAFRGRGSVVIRLAGAIATAAFGAVIILLKAFIH
jgi:hypothetical protein